MKRLSIRWRLTLWYGSVLAAILIGYSAVVYMLMQRDLLALTDAALVEELNDLAGDVMRCSGREDLAAEIGLRYASHDGYESQVSTAAGVPLFRSEGLGPRGLPISRPLPEAGAIVRKTLSIDGPGHARSAARLVDGPGGTLVVAVAVPLAPNDRAVGQLLMVLLVSGPLAIAGALGGGYLLARKALAPVDRMAATAQEITSQRLDRRLSAPNPGDELGRLAHTFNGMIERLQRSFEEVRRFTADAAHELRSPLASMRTEAEVALRAPRSPRRDRRVLEDLLEEIDRLTRLVAQLLFLCREDAGLPTGARETVRLDEVVRDAANHMQVMAAEKGLTLTIHAGSACPVHGEPDRLRQLAFNLIDNAIKYTPAGGAVAVRAGVDVGGRARLIVADSGPGIPAEHLPRVFDRFYRVDSSRSRDVDGTGLGLAICRSIAEAHGGLIRAASEPGAGCCFTVELPIAPTAASEAPDGPVPGDLAPGAAMVARSF
jgi:heavy metal sensor kinase